MHVSAAVTRLCSSRQAVVRTCQPAQQRASPDGDAAQRPAADPELVQRLTSELGMLLGDEEGDPEPLFSPEVCTCAIVCLAGMTMS